MSMEEVNEQKPGAEVAQVGESVDTASPSQADNSTKQDANTATSQTSSELTDSGNAPSTVGEEASANGVPASASTDSTDSAAPAESATGEHATATEQVSSEMPETESSGADATLADVGLRTQSNESAGDSQTDEGADSTTGGDDEPHPVREYADILRGKFQRLEAVALSDIERLLDLVEEHL
jgi:hypothetical protein